MKHIAWSGPCGTNHTIMEKGIWADNNKRGGLRKDLMAMSREEMWTSDGNWERLKEPTSGTGDWIGNWRRLSKKSNCSKGWEMPFMTWIKSLLGITGNGRMKFDGYESTNLSSRLSSWEWTESVLTIGLKRKYALKKQELSIVKHNENLVRV